MKTSTAPKKPRASRAKKNPKLCTTASCKSDAVNKGYCRLHYLANWKTMKFNDHIKAERRLNAYVDKIAKKYPKDYLEKIKEGLDDESKFKEVVEELEVELRADEPDTDNEFLEKFMRTVKVGE